MDYNPPETAEEYRSRSFFFSEGREHQVVEQMILADGGLARIVRHAFPPPIGDGVSYTFFHRKSGWDESPTVHVGLTEDEALDLYADALKADVLELD